MIFPKNAPSQRIGRVRFRLRRRMIKTNLPPCHSEEQCDEESPIFFFRAIRELPLLPLIRHLLRKCHLPPRGKAFQNADRIVSARRAGLTPAACRWPMGGKFFAALRMTIFKRFLHKKTGTERIPSVPVTLAYQPSAGGGVGSGSGSGVGSGSGWGCCCCCCCCSCSSRSCSSCSCLSCSSTSLSISSFST